MVEEFEYIEDVLTSMGDLLEKLVDAVNSLASAMAMEKDSEKSLGFKPVVTSRADSSKFSVPKLDLGEGRNVDDVQKSDADELVSGLLSGRIRGSELAKVLRDI